MTPITGQYTCVRRTTEEVGVRSDMVTVGRVGSLVEEGVCMVCGDGLRFDRFDQL